MRLYFATPSCLESRLILPALLAVGLLGACDGGSSRAPSPPLALADAITLEAVPILGVDSLLPETFAMVVAIDTGGAVAWVDDRRDSPLGTAVLGITPNAPVVRFGVRGDGPGELRNPWHLRLDADGILAYEPMRERLVQFTRDGAVVRDRAAGAVFDMSDAGLVRRSTEPEELLTVGAFDLTGGRTIIPRPTDSLWLQIAARADTGPHPELYAHAVRGDTAWIAMSVQGDLYRLVPGQPIQPFGDSVPTRLMDAAAVTRMIAHSVRPMRGPNGQRIVPAVAPEDRARLLTTPRRQTSPIGGLQFDGAGRLWRFRDALEGPRADVFRDTVQVAQVTLPCVPLFRGVQVTGRWLVLACDETDPNAKRDVVVHRFRF